MADAKPAVERLSEDESLRGDLSDIGFGPLFDWAVAAVKAYAPQAADSDALDAYTNRVRGVVQSAVQAAQDSKLDDPNALLDFDLADHDKTLAALKAVSFGDDPDDNAVQIAAVLQSGLGSGSPAPTPEAAAPAPTENPTTAAEALKTAAVQEVAQKAPEPEAGPLSEPVPAPGAVIPPQEAATESAPGQEAAQPQQAAVKKNEEGGEESASPPPPPEQSLNPEPPANPAPSNPRPGAFLDTLRSRVGQTYNSAWGIFKGLSKRRSG